MGYLECIAIIDRQNVLRFFTNKAKHNKNLAKSSCFAGIKFTN